MMVLFPREGPENTAETVRLAVEGARSRDLRHLVIASCSGATARAFLPYRHDFTLVVVTHAVGFAGPGLDEMPAAVRAELGAAGCRLVTAAHVLSGAERGLSRKFGGVYPVEIIAHTLRLFGQGVKVGVEIAVMALDAGAIPHGVDVVAVGGSGEGADTALVLRPSHVQSILETHVVEILCKPA
ncbi:MAG: pyruvate kinase alpha/beta domain-containing protein [Bacteroidota bacterium]